MKFLDFKKINRFTLLQAFPKVLAFKSLSLLYSFLKLMVIT